MESKEKYYKRWENAFGLQKTLAKPFLGYYIPQHLALKEISQIRGVG
jgi:hypothetical protein